MIRSTPGRVAVIVVGVVVVGVGGFFVLEGVRRSFRSHFDWSAMPGWARHLTQVSGAMGSVSRGAVFALAGVLVIVGAVTLDPTKAGGVDSALDTLASWSWGTLLLVLCAAGFAAFAVFAICEAVWRRTDSADGFGAAGLHS